MILRGELLHRLPGWKMETETDISSLVTGLLATVQ